VFGDALVRELPSELRFERRWDRRRPGVDSESAGRLRVSHCGHSHNRLHTDERAASSSLRETRRCDKERVQGRPLDQPTRALTTRARTARTDRRMRPTTTMTTLLVNNGTRASPTPTGSPNRTRKRDRRRTPTTLQERASALLLCKVERGDANERASKRASKQGTTATATTANTQSKETRQRRRRCLCCC